MKRILSLALAAVMAISAVPMAYAADTNDHEQGTQVVFEAANNEDWTVTVPASLKPGQGGTVTLAGKWPSNKTISVTADKTVTLTNSILASDQKVLDVTFDGISEAGSDTEAQEFTNPVSVAGIENALFGTWSGKFNYNVETETAQDPLNPDNVTVTNNKYEYGDYVYTRPVISGNRYGAQTLEEGIALFLADYGYTTWEEFVENCDEGEAEMFLEWEGLTAETFEPAVLANEWQVALNEDVTDRNQTSYGPILESINGAPVTSMCETFSYCFRLTVAPEIPDSITDMSMTFMACYDLTVAPKIPDRVTDMYSTFDNCDSLTVAPEIPDSVTNMFGTFFNCDSLTVAPEIPDSVTNMQETFANCDNLTVAPEIPNSVTNMQGTFDGCTSLTVAPEIPDSVTNINSLFQGCTSLTVAPKIPDSITDMFRTFDDCTSLTVAPEIPAGVKVMNYTFNGCTSLTTAPEIPAGVDSMFYTFDGCTSLTGEISLPCSEAHHNYTYKDCPATITYYHVDSCTGSCGK